MQEEEIEGEIDASLWVHQNILKLSKQFGVEFQECEKETLAIFMKIDRCRQNKRQQAEVSNMEIPKRKCNNELKGLISGMKFKSTGARNMGKETSIVDP